MSENRAMHGLLVGFGLGFFVAMQIGPMSLLLIRSTLRHGRHVGLAISAGIAVVDALYASCGAAGAAPLLEIEALRAALGLIGAAVLLSIGLRTMRDALRVRLGGEAEIEVASARRAFLTALAGTASNPLTIVSWAAIFSATGSVGDNGSPILLVAGVAVGSACSTSALTLAVGSARRRLSDRAVRLADAFAAAGMLGFGGVLAYDGARALEAR